MKTGTITRGAAWWGGTALGWALLLAVGLTIAALLTAVFDVLLSRMGAAEIVAAAVGAAAASACAIVVLATAAWRVGRELARRGMPARLWLVPAVVLAFMGAPGPQPWSVETIIGMVLFAGSAVAPVAAAVSFRGASRRVRSWMAAQSKVAAPATQEGV
jgi:hypothetical protein